MTDSNNKHPFVSHTLPFRYARSSAYKDAMALARKNVLLALEMCNKDDDDGDGDRDKDDGDDMLGWFDFDSNAGGGEDMQLKSGAGENETIFGGRKEKNEDNSTPKFRRQQYARHPKEESHWWLLFLTKEKKL